MLRLFVMFLFGRALPRLGKTPTTSPDEQGASNITTANLADDRRTGLDRELVNAMPEESTDGRDFKSATRTARLPTGAVAGCG